MFVATYWYKSTHNYTWRSKLDIVMMKIDFVSYYYLHQTVPFSHSRSHNMCNGNFLALLAIELAALLVTLWPYQTYYMYVSHADHMIVPQ